MVKFSNDADILKYEPALLGTLNLRGQTLVEGSNGAVNGTTFTASGVDFVQSKVAPGGAIYISLTSPIFQGEFEIVSVDSATQLTISVIRADSEDEPVPLPASGNGFFRISTLKPQAAEAAFELTRYLGIQPGDPTSDIEVSDILDTSVLKQASVFAVIADVYRLLATEEDNNDYWTASRYYRECFERARSAIKLTIDTDSDGIAEQTNMGGAVRLIRD